MIEEEKYFDATFLGGDVYTLRRLGDIGRDLAISQIPPAIASETWNQCPGLFGVDPEAVRGMTRRKRTLPALQGFYSCCQPFENSVQPTQASPSLTNSLPNRN